MDIGKKFKNHLSSLVLADIPCKPFVNRVVQYTIGMLYPLTPNRISGVPALLRMTIGYWIGGNNCGTSFPPVETALRKPDGLLAVGGPLTTARLLNAYREGIFPHCHIGPIKWWAPRSRMVLFLDDVHYGRTLRKVLKRSTYQVSFDTAFAEVMKKCGEPRKGKTPLTWISKAFIKAYSRLFEEGHAHSVEVWDENGDLIGGLYGVTIGRLYFGESMFSRRTNASKIGAAYLNGHLDAWGYVLRDIKGYTPFAEDQGGRLISRKEFGELVCKWRDVPGNQGKWKLDENVVKAIRTKGVYRRNRSGSYN
jgi:leucyl/phenylalanyl-tRNA---protein transferase